MIRNSLLVLILLTLVGCTSVQPQEAHTPEYHDVLSAAVTVAEKPAFVVYAIIADEPGVPPVVAQSLEEPQEAQEPQEQPAPVVVQRKPGTTLIVGDSTMAIFDPGLDKWNYKKYHELLGLDGNVLLLAKGETKINWVKTQLWLRPADKYYKDVQNAVISTGSNNLGSHDTADEIWKVLTHIYQDFNNRGIRVYACTLPPGKGIPSGLWAMDYPKVKAKRDELNRRIREASKTSLVYHVIDLAAPLSEGGLADDNDVERMAKSIERFPNDPAHASGTKMAQVIHRELMIGTNRAEVITVTDKSEPGPYPDD